ncbi:hypothetical protein [Sphingobium sp.]|uniref:hypothetical protein n=1 Tax=Sphingobium TaxID=165695 RepID=UPI001A30A48F|nr:hypothetical protein [Sphingobium sp.]MBJ7376396.1 hypothetical protein [Sphingobium sp.]
MTLGFAHIAMAGALAACAAGIGGYVHGVGVGVAQEQAAQRRVDAQADKARQQLQSQIDASSERHQSTEQARQVDVREIHHESQKVIERPIYRNVCVDADGIGLLDRAAATANADDLWGIAGDTRPIADRPAD